MLGGGRRKTRNFIHLLRLSCRERLAYRYIHVVTCIKLLSFVWVCDADQGGRRAASPAFTRPVGAARTPELAAPTVWCVAQLSWPCTASGHAVLEQSTARNTQRCPSQCPSCVHVCCTSHEHGCCARMCSSRARCVAQAAVSVVPSDIALVLSSSVRACWLGGNGSCSALPSTTAVGGLEPARACSCACRSPRAACCREVAVRVATVLPGSCRAVHVSHEDRGGCYCVTCDTRWPCGWSRHATICIPTNAPLACGVRKTGSNALKPFL